MMNTRLLSCICFALLVFGIGLQSARSQSRTDPPQGGCTAPDPALLRSTGPFTGRAQIPDGEKISRYNAQARAFNDCTRKLVDESNARIDRLRDAANADISRMTATANGRIDRLQAQMRQAMNGTATALPREAGAFADPDCRKPDSSLLRPFPKNSALARGRRYELEDVTFRSCVEEYFQQAAAEAERITAAANADIRRTADDANARIAALESAVKGFIDSAQAAAAAPSRAVEGTPLARNDPIISVRNAANPLENENADRSLWPVMQGTPLGEGNRREFTCRAPQQLPESRIYGPKVCRRNGTWAALRKLGKDIGPDGRTVIDLEAMRMMNPAACNRNTTGTGQAGYVNGLNCQ